MEQLPAFYDDHFAALRRAIEDGQGYKKTAMHLWPSMKPESAYARLKAATHNSDYKLDMAEVMVLCTFNGRYDPLYWLCDETMHGRPAQRAASDVAKSIVAQLDETMVNATRLMARLEALRETHPGVLEKAGR